MDPAQPTPPAGPTASLAYADVPTRLIAYIIDGIVIFLINLVVGIVLGIIGLTVIVATGGGTNWFGSIIWALIALAVSGVYFVYSWTNQRSTIGMRALSLQIGNAPEGATITTEQGIRRWLALGAVFTIAQTLNPLPLIGWVIGLAALGWVIFLLYTTASSPTKQGWHDKFANTMVVKAVRPGA